MATEQAAAGGASSNAGRGSKEPKTQLVFMVGASHGAKNGERRSVAPELAASLVARGLARYPKNKR